MSSILDAVRKDPESGGAGFGSLPSGFEPPPSGSGGRGPGSGRSAFLLAAVVVGGIALGGLASRMMSDEGESEFYRVSDDVVAMKTVETPAPVPQPSIASTKSAPVALQPSPSPGAVDRVRGALQGKQRREEPAQGKPRGANDGGPALRRAANPNRAGSVSGSGESGPAPQPSAKPKPVQAPAVVAAVASAPTPEAKPLPPVAPSVKLPVVAPSAAPPYEAPAAAKGSRPVAAQQPVGTSVKATAKPSPPAKPAVVAPKALAPAKPSAVVAKPVPAASVSPAAPPHAAPEALRPAPLPARPGPVTRPAAPAPVAVASLPKPPMPAAAPPPARPQPLDQVDSRDAVARGAVLSQRPADAPAIELMFIAWAEARSERMVSLRVGEIGIAVVREGDAAGAGVQVASIHENAVDLTWNGRTFRVVVDRF